jgi:hypothetical protein
MAGGGVRSLPTDEQRQAAALDVAYEIWSFEKSLKLRDLGEATGESPTLGTLLNESCLLHVRNILDFLYPRRRAGADDIVADDYAHGLWASRRPCPQDLRVAGMPLVDLRTRLDKELAHLTYSRISARHDQLWTKVGALGADVSVLLSLFWECLEEPEAEWLRSAQSAL